MDTYFDAQASSFVRNCSASATKPISLIRLHDFIKLKKKNENFSVRQTRQDVKVLRPSGLVVPKLIGFDATKQPAHSEDGDGINTRNVGRPLHPDVAVCP